MPTLHDVGLAAVPTRLARLDDAMQERLIDWGYTVCDAVLRSHYKEDPPLPSRSPSPDRGV